MTFDWPEVGQNLEFGAPRRPKIIFAGGSIDIYVKFCVGRLEDLDIAYNE